MAAPPVEKKKEEAGSEDAEDAELSLTWEKLDLKSGGPIVPESAALRRVSQSLHMRFKFSFHTSNYHYLVSRGEWTEAFSVGVMSPYDSLGSVVRVYLEGVTPPQLNGARKLVPNETYEVSVLFDAAASKYELWIDGELDASHDKVTGSILEKDGKMWIGQEALGLGERHKTLAPRHFFEGTLEHCYIGTQPQLLHVKAARSQ